MGAIDASTKAGVAEGIGVGSWPGIGVVEAEGVAVTCSGEGVGVAVSWPTTGVGVAGSGSDVGLEVGSAGFWSFGSVRRR